MAAAAPETEDLGRTGEFLDFWLKQRPDLDAQGLAIELTIARISLLARKGLTRIAESLGVTQTDYRIMAAIKRGSGGGPTRPSDLWKLFGLTPGAITYRVNRLVEGGFVDRFALEGDRRVILLRLSPKGEHVVHEAMTRVSALLDQRLKVLDAMPGGRPLFLRMLGALARVSEPEDEGEEPFAEEA